MILNESDKKAIENNIKVINEWLENARGQLKGEVKVKISHEYYDMRFFATHKECYLKVGYGTYYFNYTDEYKDQYLGSDYEYCLVVIKNWKMIKQEVLDGISSQQQDIDTIHNFIV